VVNKDCNQKLGLPQQNIISFIFKNLIYNYFNTGHSTVLYQAVDNETTST